MFSSVVRAFVLSLFCYVEFWFKLWVFLYYVMYVVSAFVMYVVRCLFSYFVMPSVISVFSSLVFALHHSVVLLLLVRSFVSSLCIDFVRSLGISWLLYFCMVSIVV